MSNTLKIAAVLMAVTATSAAAQGRGRNTDGVPPGQRPPAGMCRVWINGVPPGQQPGVTDCATARVNLPANARIIYGGNPSRGMAGRDDRGRMDRDQNILTRRRQLTDGSWVIERFRRDAAGNATVISTRALKGNPNGTWKNKRHGDDNEANDDRNHDRKDQRKEMKAERKDERKDLNESLRGNDDDKGNRGGKGKGKH